MRPLFADVVAGVCMRNQRAGVGVCRHGRCRHGGRAIFRQGRLQPRLMALTVPPARHAPKIAPTSTCRRAVAYDLAWMAEAEHFAGRSDMRPYTVRIIARDGPRSLLAHDRLVLPGAPEEWIAAPRAADLVLCSRRLPATVVIARQFCTAQVSVGDIANSEIEEITFLGGVTWLADDLLAQGRRRRAGRDRRRFAP